MHQALIDLPKQFSWQPRLIFDGRVKAFQGIVIGGMGGSNLASGIIDMLRPDLHVATHRDYGLPTMSTDLQKNYLFIACSYSGNTEETLDFAYKAIEQGLNLAIITTGGKLGELAMQKQIPHITLPKDGIQPRVALGYWTLAFAHLLKDSGMIDGLRRLSVYLKPTELEEQAHLLAKVCKGKTPVIYSSMKNSMLASNWKITINETSKIPAFYNTFPELNHNEMTSYDWVSKTKFLIQKFHFIFLTDQTDHPRIQTRMTTTKEMYEERDLTVSLVPLAGQMILVRIFNNLILAGLFGVELSELYKTEAEEVIMVENFKNRIRI